MAQVLASIPITISFIGATYLTSTVTHKKKRMKPKTSDSSNEQAHEGRKGGLKRVLKRGDADRAIESQGLISIEVDGDEL